MVTIYRTMDVSTGRVTPTQGVDPSLTGGTLGDNRAVTIVMTYMEGKKDVTATWVSSHYSYITFDVKGEDGQPYTFHNNSVPSFDGRRFDVPAFVVSKVRSAYLKYQFAFLDTEKDIDYDDPVIALSTVYSERIDTGRLARSAIDRLLVRDSITDPSATEDWMVNAWKDFFSNNAVLEISVGETGGEAQRTLTIRTKTGPERTVRLPVLTFDEAVPRGISPIEAFLRAEDDAGSAYFTSSTVRTVLRDLSATRQGKVARNRILPDGRTEWEVGDISLDDAEGDMPGTYMPASAESLAELSSRLTEAVGRVDAEVDALKADVEAVGQSVSDETVSRVAGDDAVRSGLEARLEALEHTVSELSDKVDAALAYYEVRNTRNAYRVTDTADVVCDGTHDSVTVEFGSEVMGVYDIRVGGKRALVQWDHAPGTGNKGVVLHGLTGFVGTLTIYAMCVVS